MLQEVTLAVQYTEWEFSCVTYVLCNMCVHNIKKSSVTKSSATKKILALKENDWLALPLQFND